MNMKSLLVLVALLCSAPAHLIAAGGQDCATVWRAHMTELGRLLALSDEPTDVILAARFGVGEPDEAGARMVRARALNPDAAGWWRMATDCAGDFRHCDRAAAILELQRIDANNGAVWFLPAPWSEADTDRRLRQIAASPRFDTYFAEWLRRYLTALERLPLPRGFRDPDSPSHGIAPSEAQLRFTWAMGMAQTDLLPGLSGLSRACRESASTKLAPERKSLCIAALRRMMANADLYLVQQVAAKRLAALLTGPAREEVVRARRRAAWQFAAWQESDGADGGTDAAADARRFDARMAAWREPGATELDVMRSRLLAAGIAREPPAGWQGSIWSEDED